MPFDIRCSQCGTELRLHESQIGSVICCPSCGGGIFVEQPRPAAPPTPAVDESIFQAFHATVAAPPVAPTAAPPAAAPAPATVPAAPAMPPSAPAPAAVPPSAVATPAVAAPPPAPAAPPATDSGMTPMPWEQFEESVEQTAFDPTQFQVTEPAPPATKLSPPAVPPAAPAQAAPPATSEFEFVPPRPAATQPLTTPRPVIAAPDEPLFLPADEGPAEPEQAGFFTPSAALAPVFAPTPPSFSAPTAAAARAPAPSALDAIIGHKPTPMRLIMLGLVVYACGTMSGVVIGKFTFGRAPAAARTGLEIIRDDGVNKNATKWITPQAAVPPAQVKPLGETIVLEHLAVRALDVQRRKVKLVRDDPITRSKQTETSEQECLVLRLLLRNKSPGVEFAPLDEIFLRPHDPRERPNYSYIECHAGSERSEISMYRLAKFSEYNLEDQPFTVLKPGQEMEALIVADQGSPALAKGKNLWRIQLRAGMIKNQGYSTVVGFEFTSDQIRG